jgi:hypothetical protein
VSFHESSEVVKNIANVTTPENIQIAKDSVFAFLNTASYEEAISVLEPLIIFVIGMVLYSVFIFKFYRFIASRNIFAIKHGRDSIPSKIFYYFKYVFLFPLVAFFWFLVLSGLLATLSQVISIGNIFMISMAIIATVRITAYYEEDLSKDVAKLVPFALLGVLLLDISNVSFANIIEVVVQMPSQALVLAYYFIFIVTLEFSLRLVSVLFRRHEEVSSKK